MAPPSSTLRSVQTRLTRQASASVWKLPGTVTSPPFRMRNVPAFKVVSPLARISVPDKVRDLTVADSGRVTVPLAMITSSSALGTPAGCQAMGVK